MAQDEKRPACLFFGHKMLNLRENLRLPRWHVRDLLALLILYIGNPDAAEIRCGMSARDGRELCHGANNAGDHKDLG